MAWTKLVSMELDDEDKMDLALPPPVSEQPDYPWALKISLTDKELTKLGLEDDLPDVGDYIHLGAMARVTSVSSNATDGQNCCRVELQIEMLAVEEEPPDPSDEDE